MSQSTGSHRALSLKSLVSQGIITPLAHAATLSVMRITGEEDERVAIAMALAQSALRLGHLGLRLNEISADFSPEVLREMRERELAERSDEQLTIASQQLHDEETTLQDWSGLPELNDWLNCLHRSPSIWTIDTPHQPCPFVLDGEILFTLKAWRGESRVAHAIRSLALIEIDDLPQPELLWKRLFAESDDSWFDGGARWDRSKLALYSAMKSAVMVIHGGPGTGKTTLTQRILAAMIEQYHQEQKPLQIAITAPTGKAAQRLTESIQSRASFFHLPEQVQSSLEALQGVTLHSLLGVAPGRRPEYHSGNPLPYDIIVVDECSMVDLWLLQSLLDAIPKQVEGRQRRRLLLIGDPQQLPSVSAGAPFTELCADRGRQISSPRLHELSQFLRSDEDTPPPSVELDEAAPHLAAHSCSGGTRERRPLSRSCRGS